ncbi:S8 family serine peptidase [Micromonospora sp. NPDC047707]|uniref:S8 family serine peptidase n=1 Tax=Micromonospora sp. NPDC047707 TaxID=3154498 RepID=UPI003454932B
MQLTSKRVAGVTALIMAMATSAIVPGGVAAARPDHDSRSVSESSRGLSQRDHELLREAKQRGRTTVQVLLATRPGKSALAIKQLADAGVKVKRQANDLGYIRAEVDVDKVDELVGLSSIQALDVDGRIRHDIEPAGIANPIPQQPPNATTPRVNSYLPVGDTGAVQFVDAHPTWDGRGTTIAILDTGIDVDHPALARTTTGERKIVDWIVTTDGGFTNGVNNDDDPTWVLTEPGIPVEYQPPLAQGNLRFGVFDERDPRLAAEFRRDVNRDGNPEGSSAKIGVAWDPTTGTVWVDGNQDKDFSNDRPMQEYKVRYDVGTFGSDNPETPIREAVPFVVQIDPESQSVNIGIVASSHGTHVAGIAAGNGLFGGAMSGAAPGAKLASIRTCTWEECRDHSVIEAAIYSAQVVNADVLNMSFGPWLSLNDGSDAIAEIFNRITDTYGVQIVVSAGNSASGTNSVIQTSVPDKVFSVGASATRATFLSNYGIDMPAEDNLLSFTAYGPREDGGFKPDFVAPGSAISAVPTWQQPAGLYALPPGYAHFNGTSMSAPQAAGATALLFSAAKATGVGHKPSALRQAILSSARFLADYQAHAQGAGLIQVGEAWKVLSHNPNASDIRSSVPVRTALSDHLPTPGIGVGIFDREGVRAGDQYVREYKFTRYSGPDEPVAYQLSWLNNDGTFESATSITLAKAIPVTVPVTVRPSRAGIHSAILRLNDPTTVGFEYQTLNTVIAAEDFGVNRFTISQEGKVGRGRLDSYYFRVTPNIKALKVELDGGGTAPGAGQIRFLTFHPYGVTGEPFTPNSSYCYNPPAAAFCGGSPTSRTLNSPTPGVWEITVDARRSSDAILAPYKLTVTALGIAVNPELDVIEEAVKGIGIHREWALVNKASPFLGKAVGGSLGSARMTTGIIRENERREFEVSVPAGSTEIRARLSNARADIASDLDLAVFDCTSGACEVVGNPLVEGAMSEEVIIESPAAGKWVVQVHGYDLSQESTTFDLLDVVTNPVFGSLTVEDSDASRPTGAAWTAQGVVTAGVAPEAGRVLFGRIKVLADGKAVAGSGDVIIRAVLS